MACRELRRVSCEARQWIAVGLPPAVEVVLLLLTPAREVTDGFGGSEHRPLRLSEVEHGGGPTVCQHLCEPQRVPARNKRSPRDFELQVKFAKLEVGSGDVTHQRTYDRFTCPLGGQ